jgi:hypothetical protein
LADGSELVVKGERYQLHDHVGDGRRLGHRLAAERMDDVPIVDDMVALAAGLPRPRLTVITGVEPRKHSSRSS